MVGLEISDERLKVIEEELRERRDAGLGGFLESRGRFDEALEWGRMSLLDRVRLLSRAGRRDEALAALAGDEFGKLAEWVQPATVLQAACRPLEDAEAWDELDKFLGILSERLESPMWRAAIWGEELDVAYHLDGVEKLLEEAAGEPLRLVVFHHRLGNGGERDRLIAELLEGATPARVADLLGMMWGSERVLAHAHELWAKEALGPEGRVALLDRFLVTGGMDFDVILLKWLEIGGNAALLGGGDLASVGEGGDALAFAVRRAGGACAAAP